MASSTASRFSTGSAPGMPRQTGQTFVFGGAPKLVGQPQKIFVAVASWTCTSRPMTGSYFAIASGSARSKVAISIIIFDPVTATIQTRGHAGYAFAAEDGCLTIMKVVHHF